MYDPSFGYQVLGVANGRIVSVLGTGILSDEVPSSSNSGASSGGGGDCVVSRRGAPVDPVLPGLIGLCLLGLWVRSSGRKHLGNTKSQC